MLKRMGGSGFFGAMTGPQMHHSGFPISFLVEKIIKKKWKLISYLWCIVSHLKTWQIRSDLEMNLSECRI